MALKLRIPLKSSPEIQGTGTSKVPPNPPSPNANYPILEALFLLRGMPLKAAYAVADAAQLFNVCRRTIQAWMKTGKLPCRDLPGHARFLGDDLEQFLRESKRRGREECAKEKRWQ